MCIVTWLIADCGDQLSGRLDELHTARSDCPPTLCEEHAVKSAAPFDSDFCGSCAVNDGDDAHSVRLSRSSGQTVSFSRVAVTPAFVASPRRPSNAETSATSGILSLQRRRP